MENLGALPLRGGGGEPVDLHALLNGHPLVDMAPARVNHAASHYQIDLAVGGMLRSLYLHERDRQLEIFVDNACDAMAREIILETIGTMFRLDEDLSRFYELAKTQADLQWVAGGAGRLLRAPTSFEDVAKAICRSGVSLREGMRLASDLTASVGHGTFPTAKHLADAPEGLLRDTLRAGTRARHLRDFAMLVLTREISPERWREGPRCTNDQVANELGRVRGISPHFIALLYLLCGRYGLRATIHDPDVFARLETVYGEFAGLAYWLTSLRGRILQSA
jgi:3-methyladenine DNA glycosylase/8-oxoguanine DNA glycosylase